MAIVNIVDETRAFIAAQPAVANHIWLRDCDTCMVFVGAPRDVLWRLDQLNNRIISDFPMYYDADINIPTFDGIIWFTDSSWAERIRDFYQGRERWRRFVRPPINATVPS